MSKPEVIGKPGKISIRITGKGKGGEKESVGFEVYGVSLKLAEEQVRVVLTNIAKAGEGS